ncbi:DUF4382 domain-containing protein [Vibrio ponticus]|uniref:DUF4382 domain-containing protein n=1 Tax=Vibrio ponticus TaxID=265668 RepID=A0A3N3E532_9VIBR|nr:DUF4382 domain-containing protein [Vibrio ponticus]ROV61835.1 DUF4382 domain-containing protein [Vibrio ponticus]
MKQIKRLMILTVSLATLWGCGSDSDSGSSTKTTPVTLAVSDAPIDDVSEVVVVYSKVAFLPIGGGAPIIFDVFKQDENGNPVDEVGDPLPPGASPIPLSVNLFDFQGSESKELIENQIIPVGDYKLCVFANDGNHPEYSSYVVNSNTSTKQSLTVKGDGNCPQGVGEMENAGVLFFNDTFSVNEQNNDFVLEFDLRRGLKEDTSVGTDYTIQRTSVSLINTVTTGNITGEVMLPVYGACEVDSPSANGHAHAVYLYSGVVEQANMGTFAGTGVMPIAAANVVSEDEGATYRYEFGFVEPGTYSVGYTCTANDDSEEGLVVGETFRIHQAHSGFVVTERQDTIVNF